MATCSQTRIDTANLNTSGTTKYGGALIYPGTGTKIYTAWMQHNALGGVSTQDQEVVSNWFDWSDKSIGVPVVIQADQGPPYASPAIQSIYLTASSTWIVAFGGNAPRVLESTNLGATWGASADPEGTYCTNSWGLVALFTDGTTAWMVTQLGSGGANSGDLRLWKRTGAGTWVKATTTLGNGIIHDASGISTIPVFYPDLATFAAARVGYMKDALTGFLVMDFANSGAPAAVDQVRCLYTTDGWATVNASVVKDYAGVSFSRVPSTLVGTDNRARCCWIDNTTGHELPYLAYSDDYGKTWTYVGNPVITQDAAGVIPSSWDNSYDRAFFLGPNNDIWLGTFDNSGATYQHRLYNGGDSLSGWTEPYICSGLTYQNYTASTGDGLIAGNNWMRLFNRANGSGWIEVNVMMVEGIDTGGSGGGAPPLTTESPSLSDTNDTLLVLDIADDRGWSSRDVQVGSFAVWNQGDYTTERRQHILLGGAVSLDPAVQDPNALIAIYKLDDLNRYTKEAFVVNADTSITPTFDPFVFRWHSKSRALAPNGEQAIVRALYVQYYRPSVSFTIEVWVDGVLAQTCVLPPSWPEPAEAWFPVGGDDTAGSLVQLRVEDHEDVDLKFAVGKIKFLPKRWRM